MHAVSKSNIFHSAFHIKKDFLVEINPFVHINPLPDNKSSDLPKFKAFADEKCGSNNGI